MKKSCISIILFAVFACCIGIPVSHSQIPFLNKPQDIDTPKVTVIKKNNPAPGEIYLSTYQNYLGTPRSFLLIVDSDGGTVFARNTDAEYALDFKPQHGYLTYFAETAEKNIALDLIYRTETDAFGALGYRTDGHEFRFLPNGGYVLLALDTQYVDMSAIYPQGNNHAAILTGVLQEFNADKTLRFQWNAWDHFRNIFDARHEFFGSAEINFTHYNAIEFDGDTAYLLSARNFDEITKISRIDGRVIWRLGGDSNQFTFTNDSLGFNYQHCVRKLPNGNIILFDNGTFHKPSFSRAVEYHLDEASRTATKVWEFRHVPDVYGAEMGSVQQLANGNRLIGWGACDDVALTEVAPNDSTALEMKFGPGIFSYRAYKYTQEEVKAMGSVSQAKAPDILLDQNYPNPCSVRTTISFHAGGFTPVELSIFDAIGRKIATLFQGSVNTGDYSAVFNAGDHSSGTYLCKLSTPSGVLTRTIIVAK